MQMPTLGLRYFGIPSVSRSTKSTATDQSNRAGSSLGTSWAPEVPASASAVRVLVVDVPGLNLARLVGILGRHPGFELLPSLNGDESLARQVARVRPDVMVLDSGLVDADTPALIRACRIASASTEILLRTHVGNDERVLACIEAGASGYFFKDAAADWIVACLLTLREGGALISPGIARRVLARFYPVVSAVPVFKARGEVVSPLNDLQVSVLRLMACGTGVPEIADVLALSTRQVLAVVKGIYRLVAGEPAAATLQEASVDECSQKTALVP